MGVQALSTSGLATFSRRNVASNGLRSLLLPPTLIAQIGSYAGPSAGFGSIQNATEDSSGNIYIRHNWNTGGAGITKVTPNFNILWSRRYPNIDGWSNAQAIGFDLSGNLLIGTSIAHPSDGRTSMGLLSINPDTGVVNQSTFNSFRFTSFSASPQQNICTRVGTQGSLYSIVDYNPGSIIAVQAARYNLSGLQSTSQGTVFGSDTRADGIMETPNGNSVFAFYNAYTNNNPVGWNPVVVRYNFNLSSISFKRVIGRANFGNQNHTYGADVTNSNQPVVSWSQFGGTDPLGITQLDSDGSTLWTWRCTQADIRPANRGIARDTSGNVYLLARLENQSETYLVKFNSAGTVLWQRRFNPGVSFSPQFLALSPDETYVTFGGALTLFGSNIQTFINYPADGSISGSYSLNYVNWTIASSSLSFTSYTSQNIDWALSTYSNNTSNDSRTIDTTNELISLDRTRMFL